MPEFLPDIFPPERQTDLTLAESLPFVCTHFRCGEGPVIMYLANLGYITCETPEQLWEAVTLLCAARRENDRALKEELSRAPAHHDISLDSLLEGL